MPTGTLKWETYVTSKGSYKISKLPTANGLLSLNKTTGLIMAYQTDDGINQDLLGLALVQPAGELIINPHFGNAYPALELHLRLAASLHFDSLTSAVPSPFKAYQATLERYPQFTAWVYPDHQCVTAHPVDSSEQTLGCLTLPFDGATHPDYASDDYNISNFLIGVAKQEIGLVLDGPPTIVPPSRSPSPGPE